MTIGTEDRRTACVIITHNRVNSVIQSLEQLARLPERPRIVLVDNGSTDGTAAVVSERFPDVEIVSTGKNIGAAARTVGVEAPQRLTLLYVMTTRGGSRVLFAALPTCSTHCRAWRSSRLGYW